ncbi:hypothetical protein QF000_007886 [Paraburkholderia atlantica]
MPAHRMNMRMIKDATDCGFSEGAEFVCEPHREWLSELARGERLK